MTADREESTLRETLLRGVVIPACPLALTADRKFDERRQRGLLRYYSAAGAGGVAVGVHSTQFAIRRGEVGLFKPVLELAAEEMACLDSGRNQPMVRIAGVCGERTQAVAEAELARDLGYHAALLSLAAMKDADEDGLIQHCRAVADVLPLVGFYLQPAVGGRVLAFDFWRRFAEIESVVAVKIAPFDRYKTLDVVRAVVESGRDDIALYTGNDDNIVMDRLTPFRVEVAGRAVERRIVGGLLGQWGVWTAKAVELLARCRELSSEEAIPAEMLRLNVELTDANAAIFDAANCFAGCIPGIHEVLRRQGLLAGTWCLDADETLSPGQGEQIGRVCSAYPHLTDDDFVASHLDEWLAD